MLDSGTTSKMSHLKWGLKTDGFLSTSKLSWEDHIGSGSTLQSSEEFEESCQPEKPSDPAEPQDKEVPTATMSSITFDQLPDVQPRTPLFSELHLTKLEKAFEENIDSNGALDLGAFTKIMKKLLSNASDEMLETLFLKVDSDCNGLVTWDKYVDYMMHEFQGIEEMRKRQYRLLFQLPMKIIPLNHGCEIIKVEFFIQRFKRIGCFLTVTKDGILQFWSESFSLMNSFVLSHPLQLHNQQMWVTDMVCLHNLNLIAVSSTELKIEFFDISNHKCVRAFTFIDLDSCVLAMNYWSDYHRGVFCYGDTKGNVIIFVSDSVTTGLFNPQVLPKVSKWDHWTNVSMQKLLSEKSALHRSYQLRALHPNWCQQVKFISELNLVVSCSAVEKSSLVLTMLPTKGVEKPKLTVLSIRRGILCFDYCPDRNFLVTGGYDSHIRLWNPLFSKKPVWMMKGHQTSVTHILLNSKNSSILISISRDKNIRVWDTQDHICLQSLCGKQCSLGNCPITSACFHKTDNTLVCTTYSIGILYGYLESQQPMKAGKASTHRAAMCNVLYSKIFKQVVSGCLHGSVCVWEVLTGRKMVDFSVSSTPLVELTSMALDESERCLLTGLRDGTMKMWNYNNGECLLTFPNPDNLEISGIVHMNKAYYVTGWSKRITNFVFHKTKPVLLCYHWQTFHAEDVLSMAKYQNQFLGTSSYNGDILFWSVNTLKPILCFNASVSPLPLQPKKVQTNECLAERHRPNKPCVVQKKWVQKAPQKFCRTTANASLRRNLVSAPPVMRHSFSASLPRDQESDVPAPNQRLLSSDSSRSTRSTLTKQSVNREAERRKGEFQKKLLLQQSTASVEKIIFLQTRPRQPHVAAMLSSCIDGRIYAWSLHGNGGLLGKFPVDLEDNGDVVVGAMTTDENDWILITGDCKGHIKIWDIKDYCTLMGQRPLHASESEIPMETKNKFRILIPKRLQMNIPHYIPLKETEVVAGQIISLVPPKLLNTWRGHLESVADILYIDTFQLVISAGQDRDVKAWKLSGDAIGTFGLDVWKRLQDAKMDGIHEQRGSFEEKSGSMGNLLKASHQELPDLAEALVYQRREQVVLMSLLNGKADAEVEAWAKLHRMAQMSPWAGDHPVKDIEASWSEWESKGKQVSKVVGAAFKPKKRLRNPKLLSTSVQLTQMKHQISPQIYQSLFCKELTPIQHPDALIHKVLDQQGRHIRWVAHDLASARDQIFMDTTLSTPIATSSHSLSPAASAFRWLDSGYPLRPQSSISLPQSASTTSPLAPPEGSESILQRPEVTTVVTSSLQQPPKPLEATLLSSARKSSHVRF